MSEYISTDHDDVYDMVLAYTFFLNIFINMTNVELACVGGSNSSYGVEAQ